MAADARRASDLLKALSNPVRLLILCQLAEGEKSVSTLEGLLKLRQPALSQQLARLRDDNLVETRRDGKMIHYRLTSDEARRLIDLLYELFCATGADAATATSGVRSAGGREGRGEPHSPRA
jgi:DNA-binding transcriptional ArsR family regulator